MKHLTRLCIATAVLILLLTGGAVRSEDPPDSARLSEDEAPSRELVELNSRVAFCRQLMRDRNYEGAAAMLELLYESYPDNSVIVALLVQCYDQLQHYEKSQEIIQRHLKLNPDNFNFQLLHAETLARRNKVAEAREAYLAAASNLALSNLVRYQTVIQSMVGNNLDTAALSFIDSLRLLTADSTLFAIHRGAVLERQKQYEAAALEFYSLLADTTRLGNEAEKKLMALLNFGESEPAVHAALLEQKDLFSVPRAVRILSSHYLKSGQYEKAFEFTVSQDSLEGFGGRSLLNYMRRCYERQLYEQAARMGEYLTAHRDTLSVRVDAHFVYADALVRLGRYDQAIAVLDSAYALSMRTNDRVHALYSIGLTYLEELAEYDRAIVYFDSVEVLYTTHPSYDLALVARPQCYLRQGDLDRASSEFENVLTRNLKPDLVEQVQFNLALIYFYQKRIDSCQTALNKLTVDFPRGMYFNDAVKLLFTIEQARGNPQILYDYSNAMLFEHRALIDSAVEKLGLIAEQSEHVLADAALYELAQISLDGDDTSQAIDYVDGLAERFPDSYYLPYGLKMKADLYSGQVDLVERAKEIYRRLLEDYPNFPFASAIRQKMRQLEQAVGSS
jgi:tetratricopeptide (TPR) repeat protein